MLSIFSQLIFGNSGVFGGSHGSILSGASSSTWKDKSLCFDLRKSDLELSHGEQLIACFFPIEDVKGNQEELGILKVTNLRLIWICCDKRRVNLSIGWRTVTLTFEQNLKDSLGSPITSLCVLTKYESTKYEFVFNKMLLPGEFSANNQDIWSHPTSIERILKGDRSSPLVSHISPMYLDEPFEVVFKVWQTYKRTHLFRHCRANLTHLLTTDPNQRSVEAKIGEINKLPSEDIIDIYCNISRFETRVLKYLGTLILTNIRLIWIDDILPLRNLSIPYIRIDSMKLKQNDRIIVSTMDYLATSNQIDLRLQKSNANSTQEANNQTKKLKPIFEQMQNLFILYKGKPKFGPESCEECLTFMSNLRPIEYYFETFDGTIAQKFENLGPPIKQTNQYELNNVRISDNAEENSNSEAQGDDQSEHDFNKYKRKLNSYLNDRSIEHDEELMYSQEFGLTVEKPRKNMDLGQIWKIDL